jgi:hypothetical protein
MPFRSFTSTLDLAEQNCATNNRAGKHACHSAEKSVLAFFCTVAYREPLRFGVASHGPKAGQNEQFTDVLVARGLPVCRLEINPAGMAGRIHAVLLAIEQRFGSMVRIDNTENAAIECAQGALAVLRGEWFGGLEESMTGSAPQKRVVILDLCRTLHGQTEWLGTFPSIESARTKLNEVSSATPGHYVIFDQTTGDEIFAESTLND